MRVSVIIPAYNEAASIGRVLGDIPAAHVSDVIVVDSDSTDETQKVALRNGARVVREPRRGYGRACLTGLKHARDPEVVVFLDGDYSDRPSELPLLIAPICEGRADIVIGSRLAGNLAPGALPWHSRWGNRLAARLISMLCGLSLTDLGPFRAARFDLLRSLELRELTYGWPVEMIVRGSLRGWRIIEVPVSYHRRIGKSKITGTFKGSIAAAWHVFSAIVKYRILDNQHRSRT